MSRLGKLGIKIPSGTEAKIEGKNIKVKGPKGELQTTLIKEAKVEIVDGEILVKVSNPENKKERALWGLYRALINNMVVGVNSGFDKKLEMKGVGYKMAVSGNKINFSLGFSHPIEFPLPQGIYASVDGNSLTISGIDKQLVGEISAQIRKLRSPEPYKGKGIKYSDEVIRRKAGKAAAK